MKVGRVRAFFSNSSWAMGEQKMGEQKMGEQKMGEQKPNCKLSKNGQKWTN